MEELLRVAALVRSPLALGGLFAAIFFLVLRQIIAKNIFPALTKAVGGEILKLIIDRLFVLALIAMILGFVAFVFTTAGSKAPDSVSVTLVNNMTLKDATEFLAELEHFTVDINETCDKSVMDSAIRGGQIKGRSTVELIEQLRLRLKDPGIRINYRVTKVQERGVYEISCN